MRQIFQRRQIPLKKTTGEYSADRAKTGARTPKSGSGRWFVGYKKHSFRLWLTQQAHAVLLVPLVSWIAPANRNDLLFLNPSVQYCYDYFEFVPQLVVGDMAYINLATQRRLREQLGVAVVTRLRPDFDLPKKIEPAVMLRCSQGQPLEWMGLNQRDQLHWFVARDTGLLCPFCPEQTQCPREFAFAPQDHEIVLGTIPVNTNVGRRLLTQVRTWIEATQSYEKNQLGLSEMFLNSLRLTWVVGLLADTVTLLRAHAQLRHPPARSPLSPLLPEQTTLDLHFDEQKLNHAKTRGFPQFRF